MAGTNGFWRDGRLGSEGLKGGTKRGIPFRFGGYPVRPGGPIKRTD